MLKSGTYKTHDRRESQPQITTVSAWLLLSRLSILITFYLSQQFSSVPPWTLKSPTILFKLTTNIKANTTPEVYQALYSELKQTYPNHQEIFTDGSKSSKKVSAAAVFLNSKLSFCTNLQTMSSIFTVELTAIKIALSNIHKTKHKLHILFSDSKSTLQSIIHKNLINRITQDILLKYNDNHHYNIIFCWIPSHVGIKGNTKADKLARITTISSTQVIPISPSDAVPILRNYIRTKWHATWDSFPNKNCTKYLLNFSIFHHYTNRILEKNKLL